VLIGGSNWRLHRPWALLALVATVAIGGWYGAAAVRAQAWPGGATLPCFTFGVGGGLIIIFELLFWWRKKVRVWRIGRAQTWLRAHIWLGLLTVPALVCHSGFRFGGPLSTVLMALLFVVVASGIWGLAMQQFLPSRVLEQVPAETIYSQIDTVVTQLYQEAEELVTAVCAEDVDGEPVAATMGEAAASGPMVIGALRSAGSVQGRVLLTRARPAPVPGSEVLSHVFSGTIAPFLRAGSRLHSPLTSTTAAGAFFEELRTRVQPAARPVVDALEDVCDQRRQLDRQARMQFWLQNWLWVHLPLSAALGILMVVHIFVALKYW